MNTLRIVLVILVCILAIPCIPIVQAVEPAWTYPVNESTISTIAVSSDGSTIIVAADRLWIFSKGGTLLKKEPYGDDVVLTPSGRFAVSSLGGTIYFFSIPLTAGPPDPKYMTKIWEYDFETPVRSIDITDDGSMVVGATEGTGIFFITTATQIRTGNDDFYNSIVRISHDGSRIAGISSDTVRLFSRNGKVSKSYVLNSNTQPDFALLSQTVPLMVFNDGSKIRSFDLSAGTELWNAMAEGPLSSLAMTPSGSFVFAGTDNGNISRYDDKGNLNWTYASNTENSQNAGILKLAVSKDGGLVAAASNEGKIFVLNARGSMMGSYPTQDRIRDIAMSQDGSIVLAGGDKNIYAFLTGYTAKNPLLTPQNTPGQNITTRQTVTRYTVIPSRTTVPIPGTITEIPTEYSVIRTPSKSPPGLYGGILALMAGIILYRSRHR
jgi:WD40 repeat protein